MCGTTLDSLAFQVTQVSAECEMICELETRFKQIQTRLQAVTQETEEVKKIAPTRAARYHILNFNEAANSL